MIAQRLFATIGIVACLTSATHAQQLRFSPNGYYRPVATAPATPGLYYNGQRAQAPLTPQYATRQAPYATRQPQSAAVQRALLRDPRITSLYASQPGYPYRASAADLRPALSSGYPATIAAPTAGAIGCNSAAYPTTYVGHSRAVGVPSGIPYPGVGYAGGRQAPYYHGDSVWGTQKVYVDGQPVRNWLRFVLPL